MTFAQKHLQAVTRALVGKEAVPIGELLSKIDKLNTDKAELLTACEGISSGPSYEWGRILKSFLAVPMIPKELAHLLKGLIVTMDDINKRAVQCQDAIAKATA